MARVEHDPHAALALGHHGVGDGDHDEAGELQVEIQPEVVALACENVGDVR